MAQFTPIFLLLLSNIFMTFAWYGHLKFKHTSLWIVILISWGLAFFEYCLQVPANRIGIKYMTTDQLKAIQEVISLTVFVIFSVTYLKEPLQWQDVLGFVLIGIGAFLIFKKF